MLIKVIGQIKEEKGKHFSYKIILINNFRGEWDENEKQSNTMAILLQARSTNRC